MSNRSLKDSESTNNESNPRSKNKLGMNRRSYLLASGVAMSSLTGCLGDDGGSDDTVTAAWVYDGSVNDEGWVKAHDEGRIAAEEEFDWLETLSQESVSVDESERVIADFAETADIVFTNSAVFEDPTASVAEDFPDTLFENGFGLRTGDNLSRYTLKTHQARYAMGVAAGLVTESDELGFISAFELPQVVREANAFALGAQSVNSDVTVTPRLVGDFIAPQETTSVVNSMANDGIDVVSAFMNTPAAASAAASNEIWGTGSGYWDQSDAGGDWYIGGGLLLWGNYYSNRVQLVRDETWEAEDYWAGVEDDVVGLGPFGPEISDDVISQSEDALSDLGSGALDMWEGTQFEGESDEPGGFIETQMSSYVDGIDGTIENL